MCLSSGISSLLASVGQIQLLSRVSERHQTPFGWFLVVFINEMMAKVKVGNSLGWWL